jgi:hypothetical protein
MRWAEHLRCWWWLRNDALDSWREDLHSTIHERLDKSHYSNRHESHYATFDEAVRDLSRVLKELKDMLRWQR